MNQLQYHKKLCIAGQLPNQVNCKACLIYHQNSVGHLTQSQLGWPAQTPLMKGSKLKMMHLFHQSEVQEQWGTNPLGGIITLHYKVISFPVPLIFGLSYASAFTSSHVCTWSLWGIHSENTLLKLPWKYPTHIILGIDGNTIHADYGGFWMEWTKEYLVQVQLPH